MFTTYAPSEGFGGPARAFHQRQTLEEAGHTVTHVVVQASPDKGDTRRSDLVELCERPHRAPIDHTYNDVDLARRAASDPDLVKRIVTHLMRHKVDLIILEQPFLIEVVRRSVDLLGIPVIYSCENIEYRLRRDLERFQTNAHRPSQRSEEVRALEAAAVKLSAHITTICPSDQKQMRAEFGCDSTLVPNGTVVSDMTLATGASPDKEPYFSFTGSNYWPNVEGFAQIATPSLAFIPPTVKIHIAGTVGNELLRTRSIIRHQPVNASRMVVRGFLSMSEMVAMMRESRSVLVPVFIGEGSNLKSADALASGSPVIMTERATHGYEDVIERDNEGVTVAKSAEEFRSAMAAAIAATSPIAEVGRDRRAELSWRRRLAPLLDVVESI